MVKYKPNLSEDINEDILEFTAGEGDGDVPYQLRKENIESDLNEVKRLLVYMVQEIAVLINNVTTEIEDLRDGLTKENKLFRIA
jgi:hypothetical protein